MPDTTTSTTQPSYTTMPNTTTTQSQQLCPQATLFNAPLSVVSRFFGIGFNIYLVNKSSQNTQTELYLIEHIPVIYNNSLGSMYSISKAGQLAITTRNEEDSTQWWKIEKMSIDISTQPFYVIKPFSTNLITDVALQYENGNLALRPYSSSNIYESQKWITSSVKVTRGIPVLNYNPTSMFTAEFDPYSSSDTITSSSLDKQNSQQVSDVLSTIKTNIKQYLTQVGGLSQVIQPVSASSLGNKEMPLNINLNLGGTPNYNNKLISSLSSFANVNGSTTQNDMLSLLDRYESKNNSKNQYLYENKDLQSAITDNSICKPLNLQEYTNKRVATCNGCRL